MVELAEAVYVYGVTPKAQYRPVCTRGVADAEVWPVEHDGLLALASHLENGRLVARDLRAHWRVLEQAFESATVLPLRFGTVMESEQAVRQQLLEANAERLSALLDQMIGLVQLNVKGRYNEDMLLREIVTSNRPIAKLRAQVANPRVRSSTGDQIVLGQLVEQEIAQRRSIDAAAVIERLEPLAVTARAEEVAHPQAFNLAFLVEREKTPGFSEVVQDLRERLGDWIELRYVGPVPPFSFAEADLSSGAPWG